MKNEALIGVWDGVFEKWSWCCDERDRFHRMIGERVGLAAVSGTFRLGDIGDLIDRASDTTWILEGICRAMDVVEAAMGCDGKMGKPPERIRA